MLTGTGVLRIEHVPIASVAFTAPPPQQAAERAQDGVAAWEVGCGEDKLPSWRSGKATTPRQEKHIASPSCWCCPVRDKDQDNVWIHFDRSERNASSLIAHMEKLADSMDVTAGIFRKEEPQTERTKAAANMANAMADSLRDALDEYENTTPPTPQALVLADKLYALAKTREFYGLRVSLDEIYTHVAELRTLATQPQQAGGDALERCPDGCFRPKARNAADCAAGCCAKWYAVRDGEAAAECKKLAAFWSTPPQPEAGGGVTDAMVEAAITALMLERGRDDWLVTPALKSDMRAALTAALSTTPASGGEHG